MKTFFSQVDDRSGERLVQGALVYALNNDIKFRRKFIKWLGIESEFKSAHEEKKHNEHRHDIVLYFKYNKVVNIELKLWAGWTYAQWNDPSNIHFVIVPRSRVKKAIQLFHSATKVKTWEEFQSSVIKGTRSALIFEGMVNYFTSGLEISTNQINKEVLLWKKVEETYIDDYEWHTDYFFNRCKEEIYDMSDKFKVRRNYSWDDRFWGLDVWYKEKSCAIWFGVVFWPVKNSFDHRMIYEIYGDCQMKGRNLIDLHNVIPNYYDKLEVIGNVICPDEQGVYRVSETVKRLRLS